MPIITGALPRTVKNVKLPPPPKGHAQAFPRHGYTFAYPELLLTSAQRVFISHKSKYQLKLFVTTILAKMNVVQAEDARSRAWPCSYERHVCEKLGFPLQESDVNRIHVALLK